MSRPFQSNLFMKKRVDTAQTLADNLCRITTKPGKKRNVRGWAGKNNATLARNVSRIIAGEHSPSVELLDEIAEKAGNLQAWHLLYPGLDPSNPPVMAMTENERILYRNIKRSAADLPDLP